MESQNIAINTFDKITEDTKELLDLFRTVLIGANLPEIATLLPWVDEDPTLESDREPSDEAVIQAFSICFQLLNMVEENAVNQVRRDREKIAGHESEPGMWGNRLLGIHQDGLGAAKAREALSKLHIEPVLTAHPTEAKRPLVLGLHRELYQMLFKRENSIWTGRERGLINDDIRALLEGLWRSGEIFTQKPSVATELDNILHYLTQVFPAVLPRMDASFRTSWAQHFGDAGGDLPDPPKLSFGTWVGGDRDGHPLVTSQVTSDTLRRLHREGRALQSQALKELAQALPMSARFCPISEDLRKKLGETWKHTTPEMRDELGEHKDEPWRLLVLLWATRCHQDHPLAYENPQELDADLQELQDGLQNIGASAVIERHVYPMRRSLQVFGFHLAVLDVRQNSGFHDKAMAQILTKAGVANGSNWADWSEDDRVRWLDTELRNRRPLLNPADSLSDEAEAVIDCYRVLAKYGLTSGRDGLGSLIVSMTRSLSDLLTVYVLARETRLVAPEGDTPAVIMPVVPLFETIDDLQRAPGILDAFLSHPVTRASMDERGQAIQQVMIGYSDSNKDGGYLASQWTLRQSQTALAKVGQKHGVDIQFFHGRGGTPGRGAGPTHRFLDALPKGSFSGSLRVTEQGETIAQKFANIGTAHHELELITAGSFATMVSGQDPISDDAIQVRIFDELVKESHRVYRAFIEDPDFMTYWSSATPIDAIENSSIGSRPARRTGRRTLDDLRAIPWVFSWNQSRHYLPAWYGVGSALAHLEKTDPEGFNWLCTEGQQWPFLRYCLYNAETALTSADLTIIAAYASLVEDEAVRSKHLERIRTEHANTTAMIDKVFGKPREERRPRMLRTLDLRHDALNTLHHKQVDLIRRWRFLKKNGDDDSAAQLLPQVLLSVNAIASGLRTTG